jgi:hypothetical protein
MEVGMSLQLLIIINAVVTGEHARGGSWRLMQAVSWTMIVS